MALKKVIYSRIILLVFLMLGHVQLTIATPMGYTDNGHYLTNDVTNLDWLDISATKGMTYNKILAEMGPGGLFSGYRFATKSELSGLFVDWFGSSAGNVRGSNTGALSSNVELSLTLVNSDVFSWGLYNEQGLANTESYKADEVYTASHIEGEGLVLGMLADTTNDLSVHIVGGLQFRHDSFGFRSSFWSPSTGGLSVDSSNSHTGAWLVSSPVPVPASIWFMGAGLLGLLGFGRKNKDQAVTG